ncbi:DUF2817 domain-containing protein [candidate division KSB1 bacterium]
MKRFLKVLPVIAILIAVFVFSVNAQIIRTASELVDFEEYTSYEEMMEFLQEIQATSTEMLLSSYGETIEGRKIPYAIFGRPLITQPWEAMLSGKPIVIMAANIHGGERTVREGLLLLTRELAEIGSSMNDLLDDLVILMVPSINPDGFTRGSRGNSTGVDMNRDYIKLEQQALYHWVTDMLLTWQPHLWLDGHNGGAVPYNICYQGPAHAASDQRITELCDMEIFPFITQEMAKEGYKSWYYSGGNETRWNTAPTEPRISINYAGFINNFGILFESPRQDRKTGALSALVASRALLQYVADNPNKIMDTVNRARRETIEMGMNATGDIPVQMTKEAEDWKVSYEIVTREGGTPDPNNPRRITGGTEKIVQITNADLMKKPVATKTRPRPYAYILEPRAKKAVELLKKQKITIEVLQEDTELDIEAYNATEINRGTIYDHPGAVQSIVCADEMVKRTQTFPKGTYIIRTGQAMGRIICHMLEPETTDNVITWNTMDALLPRVGGGQGGRGGAMPTAQMAARGGGGGARAGQPPTGARAGQRGGQQRQAIIPIFKLMVPTALKTKVLDK